MPESQAIVGAPIRLPRRYSMRTGLLALVVACISPALVVASVAVYESYVIQKERIFRDTIFLARNLTAILDRELTGVEAGLQMLASSPDLIAGNLAGFHERARDAARFQIVDHYVLTDKDGRQLINTQVPFGTPLPTASAPAELGRVFHTRSPVLSGLFTGGMSLRPTIALGVPVVRSDEVIYSLNVGILPERIGKVLGRRALPDGWVAAVLDGSGTIVARTRDTSKFVGQKAVPALARAVQQESEGSLETVTKEGTPVYTAFSRSSLSGWTVAAGAPMTLVTTDLYRSIGWVALGTLLAFGLGLWLALRLAYRLTSAVQGLVSPALALGKGRAVELPATRIKEVAEVGGALLQASRMLAHAQHLAHYDPLTGLCNRVLFSELVLRELAVAQRSGESFAILAIDLDGFKAVNDMHGHAAGDAVLKEAAERMADAVRVSDVAARLGGDEFAVLLIGANKENARLVAEALVECLSQPYPGIRATVSASVGVAVFPHSGMALRQLLERADVALYKAKGEGKRRVVMDA
ncbi:sensor domain-containing diguanylate cyclase [Achromobacter denitrificans]|uniref:sensor domain-containing diguanylate cyclase n=1 Tax=Achromobacter denitrificans TaxID=32002 RepID=UPI0023E8BA8F|nr:sensor domain-containing diguanylate cyclase [Achromobacter denitrificans]MDF3851110.1 sensor domain-containing diguanylate cyclase [Achromobacter denitrificans]MDF3862522.1 sensor domain-containing diguanylate cyclase [Achromobacter denitrificans]